LGPEYLIYRFYVNKSIGDNINENGGGSSFVCCITLPRKWQPSLSVDVRWEVDHILKSTRADAPDTAELQGIYHAQVPVEEYKEVGNLYVHFFPNGRVRVVVSPFSSDSEEHPVRMKDMRALRRATKGKVVKGLFTPEEMAAYEKEASERNKQGGWR
jgi:hypothetical protein